MPAELTPLHLIFYLFAMVAVCSAIVVITARNPVRSVLALVVTFFAMSGEWMLLRAEFLSLVLLLVYVGAVMTLFLFVVMMLNIDKANQKGSFVRYLPFGILIVLLLTGLMMTAVAPTYFGPATYPTPAPESANFSNLQYVGQSLFTDFAYPFEIAGIILLAAMLAAIMLAHRPAHKRKGQFVAEQVAVRAQDRVQLVNLKKGN